MSDGIGLSGSTAGGDVPSGTADSGNPVKVGGVTSTSIPTPETTGKRKDLWVSVNGAAVVAGTASAGSDASNALFFPTYDGVTNRPVALATFNNATWDRLRSVSASNVAAAQQLGAVLAALPGQWSVVSAPAANTQATASKAAGGAGVRHVATAISATFVAGTTAPAAAQVTVNLRDGATGAGTVLWAAVLALPATAGASSTPLVISGLNIPGTANTAMTLEFSAAGGANTVEAVSLQGYSVA